MRYRYTKRIKSNSVAVAGGLLGLVSVLGLLSNAVYPDSSGATPGLSHHSVCSRSAGAKAYCHAQIVTRAKDGKPLATVSYSSGYRPQDLQSAYALPAGTSGSFVWNNQTVAIVDAYDNPNAASDVLAYRKQFNLPLCATSNSTPTVNDLVGCLFSKVNQSGLASPLPSGNTGWGQEIDLDIEMASAVCPDCRILLVEANSNYFSDLGAAVDRAAAMGANTISNSYGGSEFSSETSSTYDGHFHHPGIAITVSSGDSGYGVEYPAASQYVTAVGGTSLARNSNTSRGWSETAWSGAGSGCSAYEPRLGWQPIVGACTHRIVADVSADADPNTGVAVYDSYGSSNGANWYIFGGTSVASPIIASVYALAGNAGGSAPSITYGEYPYSHTANLFDVTSGSNGRCASRRNSANLALCTAISGYDGPTGLGTPNGVSAF
jgi:subtilase family serine protease